MALQPIPQTWYRSCSSPHLQFFQSQTQTNAIFKFSLSCSNHTTQVEIKVVNKKNKNSFADQIRDKWSLKLPSQTDKFPWQQQPQQELQPEPQQQQQQPQSNNNESNSSLNFEFPKRLSPWSVAENPKHPQLDSESDGSEENEKPLRHNSVVEREVQESENCSLKKRRNNTELAESLIPAHELKRLRNVALRMVERFSVGVAGITQELVDSVHEKWMVDEVVKFKFESPLSKNMTRAHQILESKTGGIVVWRSGSSIVLYRGMSYKLPCVESYRKVCDAKENAMDNSVDVGSGSGSSTQVSVKETVVPIESFNRDSAVYLKDMSEEESMELIELNHLLDELGPRFKDWTGREPLPVDADQLPAVVPGYKTPFRLLPYGVKPSLSNKKMTVMRRIARRTAPHFALGRNRELQGLARAIVKLWETSALAKIAIKRGVPFTSNERMAEVLKKLTGGTLLSRNKEYIVIYRGNDFLPPVVTKTLTERQKLTVLQQDEEEKARQKASSITISNSKSSQRPLFAGTLAETKAATANWGHQPCTQEVEKMMRESTLDRLSSLIRSHKNKLALAKAKFRKAEKDLVKIQGNFNPADLPTDLETLTNEERFLFRKIGLSMKPYLLLGRRDVYAGTIENMHLHWKYRELVKILVKGKNLAQVKHIAISLEAESGGVLVSVDKDTKGHIIIIYRGKNYFRPQVMRPKSLLTRRQALARSMELQRREALKHHISDLQEMIDLLISELEDMKNEKVFDGGKTMYSTLDNNTVSLNDSSGDLNLKHRNKLT